MTAPYLPLDERRQVSFKLTERDVEILKAVNRYRYMRTSQVWHLIFPENTTNQAAARRLKYLYHNGFFGRVQPLIQPGHGSGEMAYYLDKAGQDLLRDHEEDVFQYGKSGQVKRAFLQHALDLSEFRLCLETALQGNEIVELHRFTCDFEVKGHTDRAVGNRRYKLYHEVIHPLTRERFVVYPDGLIILKGKGKYEQFQKLYFLEIDRGTEGLSRIRDKVIGYNLYLREEVYKKFGEFDDFKVLLQTSSPKRAKNIRRCLVDQEGTDFVWITSMEQVNRDSILTSPIWMDHRQEAKALLKG